MKNQMLLFLSIILPATVLTSIIIAFVNRMARNANNTGTEPSFLLFKGALLALTGYIFSGLVIPMITLFRVTSELLGADFLKSMSQYYVAFIVTAITALALTFALGFLLFNMFYKKSKLSFAMANDEKEAVYFFIGLLLLFGFIVKEFLPHIVEIFIPYPQIPMYH